MFSNDRSLPLFCETQGISINSLNLNSKNVLFYLLKFISYLRKKRPKIIFAHSFYPSLILALSKPFFRNTIFVAVRHHNQVHLISKNLKGRLGDRIISSFVDHIVAVSNSVQHTLIFEGTGSNKISTIFNGIPIPNFRYQIDCKKPVPRTYQLLAIGRIDWQKNYFDMFHIVKNIREQNIDVKLTILGTGPQHYFKELIQLQEELGLSEHIQWAGRQEAVYEYMNSSDIFIHTALDEACPLVLIEALLFGIPLVSSNLGGCNDVLSPFQVGFDPSNHSEFATQVISVLKNLDTKKHEAAHHARLAAVIYSPLKMQQEYDKLTRRLLNS
jgi:glycosyltransferase involved in cell wall biosynthesis